MGTLASAINIAFSTLTVAALLLSAALAVGLCSKRVRESAFGRFFGERHLLVAFVAAVLATAGSLL